MNQQIKTGVGVIIIIIIGVTAVMFTWLWMKNQAEISGQKAAMKSAGFDLQSAPNANQAHPGSMPMIYSDDSASWYVAPKEVKIKLFKEDNQLPYKIWEIGNLKNDGEKIFLAAIDNQDPSGISTVRFIQASFNSNEFQIRTLEKYSSTGYSGYEWNDSIITGADNWTTIRSLEFPGIIGGPNGSKLKKEEDFPSDYTDLESVYFNNANSKITSSQKVFSDPVYGDFFLGKDNGLYVKSPDGTYKIYSLYMSIMGENEVPKVIWSDGSTNTAPFTFKTMSGCGSTGYAALVSDDNISENDLIPLWKTSNNEQVFGLKDKNSEFLKKWYQENLDWFKNDPDTFFAMSGNNGKFKKNITYEEFLSLHPLFYWKDQLGRMVRFMNTDLIVASGGCGKPVIYLYPEKTTKVSVKVSPAGGMSVSEPSYDRGWNVIADPDSNLNNLADGKKYPYLFWEGIGDSIYRMPRYGFVTERENLEKLLNDKLALNGLNNKEINDFKEFWLSRMLAENKPYYFVTFVSRREIDKLAPLEINPRPDTIIRVLMDYKGLDKYESVPGFEIKTPERRGFTVVEWGGVLK